MFIDVSTTDVSIVFRRIIISLTHNSRNNGRIYVEGMSMPIHGVN